MKLHVIYDSESKNLNAYSDDGKMVKHLVTDRLMDLVIRPGRMIFQKPEFEGDDRNDPSSCDHGCNLCNLCDHCGSCGCDDPQCCGTHIAPCILLEAGIDPNSILELRPGDGCLTIVPAVEDEDAPDLEEDDLERIALDLLSVLEEFGMDIFKLAELLDEVLEDE